VNRQTDIEAYGKDEDEWLCTGEFSQSSAPGQVVAAGYRKFPQRKAKARH
jgi:hypothetical protein